MCTNGEQCSCGTGFWVKNSKNEICLITNKHVLNVYHSFDAVFHEAINLLDQPKSSSAEHCYDCRKKIFFSDGVYAGGGISFGARLFPA